MTIGIPSFILALEPNNERINGRIIVNVLKKSLPTALTITLNIIIIMILPSFIRLSQDDVSTLCVVMTGLTGFMLLYRICVPFNKIRRILFVILALMFVVGVVFFREIFSLTILTPTMCLLILGLFTFALTIFNFFTGLFYKISRKIKW